MKQPITIEQIAKLNTPICKDCGSKLRYGVCENCKNRIAVDELERFAEELKREKEKV